MSSNLGTLTPKLLPISTEHGKRNRSTCDRTVLSGDKSLEDEVRGRTKSLSKCGKMSRSFGVNTITATRHL